MDLKACDRCGTQFRHLVTRSIGSIVTSEDFPYPPTGAELPKLETGIRRLNRVVLPVGGKDKGADNRPKEFHSFPEMDVCAKCVLELEAAVAKWFAEKP